MTLDTVLSRIDSDMPQAIDRLMELLRIQSISTDPAYKDACQSAADWLVADLQGLGIDARKYATPGHPMVVGQVGQDKDGPHILFYGHYDVQPVDPLELWNSPPFEPQIEEGPTGPLIRARGASDDKGQLMTFVEACRAWIAEKGELPCRITFFFEGEEESGSPSLVPFMKEHADMLRADMALICDTGLFQSKTPAIITQLRGGVSEEVTIKAASRDLHSGMYGGAAINPIRILSKALGALHDDEGRVTLPGFYDGVPDLPDHIAQQWDALNFDHAAFLGDVGLSVPAGESGYSPLEMIWSRPTAEITGITGGYTGDGFKTVLPAEATAKVSFRLVADQDPIKVRDAFRDHIRAHLPTDCDAEFIGHGASAAVNMSTEPSFFEAARQALSDEWPEDAAFAGCGGSIPIAGHFQDILDTPPLLIGFAKDDDALHSPNEKYDVESFHKGIRSWARILEALAP